MAQITIYLPERVATEARRRARRAQKSLSAYVTEILERETSGEGWPPGFVDLLRRGTGSLVEPDDPPPEDVEPLA